VLSTTNNNCLAATFVYLKRAVGNASDWLPAREAARIDLVSSAVSGQKLATDRNRRLFGMSDALEENTCRPLELLLSFHTFLCQHKMIFPDESF
jgi:hypothetical protein